MEKIENLIGSRVKERRTALGLTQTDLAKNAKSSLTTINRLEKGRQLPHSDTLAEIAKALNFTVEELLFDKAVPVPTSLSKSELLISLYSEAPTLTEDELQNLVTIARGYNATRR